MLFGSIVPYATFLCSTHKYTNFGKQRLSVLRQFFPNESKRKRTGLAASGVRQKTAGEIVKENRFVNSLLCGRSPEVGIATLKFLEKLDLEVEYFSILLLGISMSNLISRVGFFLGLSSESGRIGRSRLHHLSESLQQIERLIELVLVCTLGDLTNGSGELGVDRPRFDL